MYWTLDNRPPTVDEILQQGAERIRAAVESAIERHDFPKLEVRCTEVYDDARIDSRSEHASLQNAALAQMAAQQDMNARFGRHLSGFSNYNQSAPPTSIIGMAISGLGGVL